MTDVYTGNLYDRIVIGAGAAASMNGTFGTRRPVDRALMIPAARDT